ncbi:MAG: light-harvesting protein [Parvularculaceae bacterium]
MNNARMWLVVNPTVGIPAFLGAVAVGSFAVHASILTSTEWVDDFLAGRPLGSTASAKLDAPAEAKIVFTDENAAGEAQRAVIVLEDGRTAEVVFDAPAAATAVASARVETDGSALE